MTVDALQSQFEIYQDVLLKMRKHNKKLTKFQTEMIQRCLMVMIHNHNMIFVELGGRREIKKNEKV